MLNDKMLKNLTKEELEELKKNLINKKQDKKLKYVNKRKVRNEKIQNKNSKKSKSFNEVYRFFK